MIKTHMSCCYKKIINGSECVRKWSHTYLQEVNYFPTRAHPVAFYSFYTTWPASLCYHFCILYRVGDSYRFTWTDTGDSFHSNVNVSLQTTSPYQFQSKRRYYRNYIVTIETITYYDDNALIHRTDLSIQQPCGIKVFLYELFCELYLKNFRFNT